jgi:hypothetical protein
MVPAGMGKRLDRVPPLDVGAVQGGDVLHLALRPFPRQIALAAWGWRMRVDLNQFQPVCASARWGRQRQRIRRVSKWG